MNSKFLFIVGMFVVFICVGIAITTTFHVVYWSMVYAKKEGYVLADFQVETVRAQGSGKRSGFWKHWILEGTVNGKTETFGIPLRESDVPPHTTGDVVQIYYNPTRADISIEGHRLRVVRVKEFGLAGRKLFLSLIGLGGSLVVGWPIIIKLRKERVRFLKKS